MSRATLYVGDALEVLRTLPDESVQCCVTSPPYWGLRDYGVEGQLGLEPTPFLYAEDMVTAFQEVRRVLRDDGTLWLVLGDSHQNAKGQAGGVDPKQPARRHGLRPQDVSIPGLKPKDLVGIPWRVAFALQADGWWLRSDIIWAKPNPMPESVRDRPTRSHEYVFLFSKGRRYFYDADAIAEALATNPAERYPERARITGRGTQGAAAVRGNDRDKSGGFPPRRSGNKARKSEPYRQSDVGSSVPWEDNGTGRNARSVWTIATKPYPRAHFATFPPELAERCIKAGSRTGDTVLDPFGGSGTTASVATGLGRNAIHIDLNPEYLEMAVERIGPLLVDVKEVAA